MTRQLASKFLVHLSFHRWEGDAVEVQQPLHCAERLYIRNWVEILLFDGIPIWGTALSSPQTRWEIYWGQSQVLPSLASVGCALPSQQRGDLQRLEARERYPWSVGAPKADRFRNFQDGQWRDEDVAHVLWHRWIFGSWGGEWARAQ